MRRIYLHPLPLRIWHWINATCFILLVLTAIQIRYVGLVDVVSFHAAVVWHNWLGFIVTANFFLWFFIHIFSRKARFYHAELNPVTLFKGSLSQLVYYSYGLFKGRPNPFHVSDDVKFNPLQALTYQIVMLVMVPLQIITGLLMWDINRFARIIDFFGGIRVIDTVHVVNFIAIVCYIPLHAYLASLGRTPTEHYKAMITGYEDVEDEQGGHAQ
jgi:thiosulfate reductase cytochrome b subunit